MQGPSENVGWLLATRFERNVTRNQMLPEFSLQTLNASCCERGHIISQARRQDPF
jgi:hypothetical protein